jgi:hypothetical protein
VREALSHVDTMTEASLYIRLDLSRTTCELKATVEVVFNLEVVSHEIRELEAQERAKTSCLANRDKLRLSSKVLYCLSRPVGLASRSE